MDYGQPVNKTTSGTIATRGGILTGFYVNSTTAGTIALADANGAIGGTMTPAIGWHFLPIGYVGALNVVVGGTIDVTFVVSTVA